MSLHAEKRKNEEALRQKYQEALQNPELKAEMKQKRWDKKHKKKSPEEIAQFIPKWPDMKHFAVRPIDECRANTYNADRQKEYLMRHCFEKYPTPSFMRDFVIEAQKWAPNELKQAETRYKDFINDMMIQWYVAIATGKSFPKETAGFMTKKESAVFLSAPEFFTPKNNIWWSKCVVAGMSKDSAVDVVQYLLKNFDPFDAHKENIKDAIIFFARYGDQITRNEMQEMCDYLSRALTNQRFSMKHRTPKSLIELSNEWHQNVQRAKYGKFTTWHGMGIKDWLKYQENKISWKIFELTNSKQLFDEGRRMHHCVGSYVNRCLHERTSIFSMIGYINLQEQWDDKGVLFYDFVDTPVGGRVTIEVDRSGARNYIVQTKRAYNHPPSGMENSVIREWANANGLYFY